MEFKKWTRDEVEKFCEDNWVENVDWLFNFVGGCEASVDMDTSTNKEGNLVVNIKGKEN